MTWDKVLKTVLCFLLLSVTQKVSAQKIALLDTRLKSPIVYTDSVSSQVAGGYFAVPFRGMDTLCSNLSYLVEMLSKPQRSKMQSFQLQTAATRIDISRLPMAYADRYRITVESRIGDVGSFITLSDGEATNKQVAEKIKKYLTYLRSNNSLFIDPKTIHPKFYNVVVISDR